MSLRSSLEVFPCGSTGEGWGVGLGAARVRSTVVWFRLSICSVEDLLDSHGARSKVHTMNGYTDPVK